MPRQAGCHSASVAARSVCCVLVAYLSDQASRTEIEARPQERDITAMADGGEWVEGYVSEAVAAIIIALDVLHDGYKHTGGGDPRP